MTVYEYRDSTRALLADAPSLARSPAEAALFLVPAFATNMEALREYYSHAQRHVATHHPWWTASGGANHLWWSTADGGGCELNQLRETRHSVAVAHYIKANRSGGYRRTNERCGVASKDRTDDDLGREAYSEGVRQLVWKHLRKADGFKVVARSPSYEDDWADARVCLAPLGIGWGIRLLWSVLAGCVPLLASSEVSPWFDRVLPWEGMALLGVDQRELPRLPALLARLPEETLVQKQKALWHYRRTLLWPPAGIAYNVTLREICVRAEGLARGRGARWKWDCDALLPAGLTQSLHSKRWKGSK
ncbi:hypothetical protein EMIHUDRAFT_229339 [Emiliania huxleyi CCMP1516]|uniref:Exostosin GT47 domain-containing protein n=2 Tax=Emiliania huxleyi TaxID=2903 RepID=A0A0D3KCZ3_EMIH1|nr:hypothetical protein EMIHUDRAFT_229339 [Emiliania huxleyi CCMP1516]EOD33628.1 hypothetical protein EMIHUDRAFT_229339 [Emiliania huxleyi CCMP1516]|eukprot:XP_005786057.1 hypothetical protein EMIHUDRAFT_229339 [Emiliania huxleyi CCMP1516]